MKLLFDQNLSPRLANRLADLFPESSHVVLAGLSEAMDTEVRDFARANGYVIVTKDSDFSDLGLARGFPPKVIWLRLGNCTTQQIEQVLRANHATILTLETEPDLGVLVLF